jgi:hypothetical protein
MRHPREETDIENENFLQKAKMEHSAGVIPQFQAGIILLK